jgi:hypothetical protein
MSSHIHHSLSLVTDPQGSGHIWWTDKRGPVGRGNLSYATAARMIIRKLREAERTGREPIAREAQQAYAGADMQRLLLSLQGGHGAQHLTVLKGRSASGLDSTGHTGIS